MPLDSNLPTYYFKPPNEKHRPFDCPILFTQFDSEPEPRYILRQPDPASPQVKNCYAVALFDAYIPDVIFGETLVKPEWTQPTLSQEEIRKNGGVPPRPQPVIPGEVTIQLYAPDQQIVLSEKAGSWNNSPSYHFSMPQMTFRTPSASTLDYSANDPTASLATPQIQFMWKRDGRKDLKCFVTGKSTDNGQKKKGGKEPHIIVAIFEDFKDLTIYEPNLHRVEMEDYKGLEIVLLLTATTTRDIYCGQKRDCFNTGEAPRKNSAGVLGRKPSTPLLSLNSSTANLLHTNKPSPSNALSSQRRQTDPFGDWIPPSGPTGVPPADPRTQWEIDAETARLRQQTEAEKKAQELRRREQLRRDEEEARRVRKMLDAEEKERRRQQAAVDKETARLKKMYGDQSTLVSHPPRQPIPQRQSYPTGPWSGHPSGIPPDHRRPAAQPPARPQPTPYFDHHLGQAPPAASRSSFFHAAAAPQQRPAQRPSVTTHHVASSSLNLTPHHGGHGQGQQRLKPKKSFWGFLAGDPEPRLTKQKSTHF